MKTEEAQLLILKGMIADVPKEEQRKIFECAEKIRETVKEFGDIGNAALALVALELATK